MNITEKLKNYLISTQLPYSINNNFLLTDLEKVLYAATFYNTNYYCNKKLSIDIINIIDEWKCLSYSDDLFILKNANLYNIITDDKTNYSAQIIFPLYKNKELVGLTIFFRNKGNYILSSAKAPNTIRKFIMKYLENDSNIS